MASLKGKDVFTKQVSLKKLKNRIKNIKEKITSATNIDTLHFYAAMVMAVEIKGVDFITHEGNKTRYSLGFNWSSNQHDHLKVETDVIGEVALQRCFFSDCQ